VNDYSYGHTAPDTDCDRCQHDSFWHRLDGDLNLDPLHPDAPFRCCGPNLVGCDCPDFAASPAYEAWLAVGVVPISQPQRTSND
jgi:hypothetical protein